MTKLNVIVALARGTKSRVYEALTALHRHASKAELYSGLSRTYQSKADDGDELPPEGTQRQLDADDVLAEIRRLLTESWNVEGTLASSNQEARANLVVDDQLIVEAVPTTYLLYLDKQLNDFYTAIAKLPTPDPSEKWHWDEAQGCWVTEPFRTTRTKKTPRSLVTHPGNDRHPPQVHVYEDVTVEGYWTTTRFSGAIAADRKREILLRIAKLKDAVKAARERANMTDVTDFHPAEALLTYALGSPSARGSA
jgi:hypothetical protein